MPGRVWASSYAVPLTEILMKKTSSGGALAVKSPKFSWSNANGEPAGRKDDVDQLAGG